MKIVIGVDGSRDGEQAIRYVGRLLARQTPAEGEAQVLLFHACEVPFIPSGEFHFVDADTFVELREVIIIRAEDLLEEAETLLTELVGQAPVTIRTRYDFVPPAQGLADAAARADADLVVVGTRGLTGLRRLALGSVSQRIAEMAPCSVLIVRDHDQDAA